MPQKQTKKLPCNYRDLSVKDKILVRGEYVQQQGGLCLHCKNSLTLSANEYEKPHHPIDWSLFPGGKEGFLKHPIHLHHDHKTGLTLRAVHSFCNAWLWFYLGEEP